MSLSIFCPQCDALVLAEPTCQACGWRRPPPAEAGSQVWQYHVGAKLRCTSLAASGDLLLFGDAGRKDQPGAVHALDAATGEPSWRTPLPQGAPADSLAVGQGLVYVSAAETGDLSPDKSLLALAVENGEAVWSYRSGALNLSAPLLHGGLVYVASSDRKLHAVDSANGKRVWITDLSGWGRAAPTVGEGLLFLGSEQDRLLALDLADGRERWSFESKGWFAATPTVHEGVVYAACWDGSLYALAVESGELVWRLDLGPHAYLLTWPVVVGERVLVGSRDHCLYAVDRQQGDILWRFETERRVYAAPAVAQGLIYLGSDDHFLYALDLETGMPQWQIELPRRCRTAPLIVEHRLYVACQGGEVMALALGEEEGIEEPEVYLARQEYDKAAAALALHGEWAEAARLFGDQLGQPYRAAQLYERAGDATRAARQYEKAGQQERALAQWRKLGKTEAVVRILQDMGRALDAAQELEQAGQLEAAAEFYEKVLQQPAKAADLYRQAGRLRKALTCYTRVRDWGNEIDVLLKLGRPEDAALRYEEVGEYARAVDLYLKAERPSLAAAMWAGQGQHREAAELYEQAGDLPEAANQYEQAEAWATAAGLYQRLGQPVKAARCYEAQEAFLLAGTRYEEAALELEEESQGKAQQHLAELFAQAERCFAQEYERERQKRCRQKVRYYRRQPNLMLLLTQNEAFVEGAHNYLTFELSNRGRGVAKDVEVVLKPVIEGTFAGELSKTIPGIGRFGTHRGTLAVLPRASGKLTLEVQVRYHDRHGEPLKEQGRWFVDVRLEAGSGRFTPQEIHVHGDYVAGEKVTGDYIAEGGQKGDRIDIRRGGVVGPRVSLGEEADLACQHCGAPQPVGAAFCEQCGRKLEKRQ